METGQTSRVPDGSYLGVQPVEVCHRDLEGGRERERKGEREGGREEGRERGGRNR